MTKEIIVLPEDKEWARARIAELEQAILDLGPEFYDVFNQSSETWHDNAPFDALRDRQSVLDAELQNLRKILRQSAVSAPKPKQDTVGIGSVVTVRDQRDIERTYKVAGDWTPHAGIKRGGTMVISRLSPLGEALFGARSDQRIATGKVEYTILKIDN